MMEIAESFKKDGELMIEKGYGMALRKAENLRPVLKEILSQASDRKLIVVLSSCRMLQFRVAFLVGI